MQQFNLSRVIKKDSNSFRKNEIIFIARSVFYSYSNKVVGKSIYQTHINITCTHKMKTTFSQFWVHLAEMYKCNIGLFFRFLKKRGGGELDKEISPLTKGENLKHSLFTLKTLNTYNCAGE